MRHWFCFALLLVIASPARVMPATIMQGVISNEVQVQLSSLGATSGDSLVMDVRNLSKVQQIWEVPPGLVVEPQSASAPPMVIRALKGRRVDESRYEAMDRIQLEGGASGQFVLEGYSMDMRRSATTNGAAYTISALRNDLAQMFAISVKTGATSRVVQTAVWLAAMDVPPAQIQAALQLPVAEFNQALNLASTVRSDLKISATPRPAVLPMQSAPTTKPASGEPPLFLEFKKLTIGSDAKRRSATVRMAYRWTVPPEKRPSVYIIAVRFESAEVVSAVVPARMEFDGNDGEYESVVEQGALKGKGDFVYAVLGDMTAATGVEVLNKKFDEFAKQPSKELLSNILRVPVDWRANSDSPLDSALALISAPASAPASQPISVSPMPQFSPKPTPVMAKRPQPSPTATPKPMTRVLEKPQVIDLPLKNGGVLRGELLGMRDGQLVMKGRAWEFEFDPASIGTPQEILAEAQSALQAGRGSHARQLASIAGLLLDDPSPAAAILQQVP